MNRLVDALLARRQVVDLAAGGEAAPFDLLQDFLGNALFSGPEWESLVSVAELYRRLRDGYLPTVTGPDWDDALNVAEAGTASALTTNVHRVGRVCQIFGVTDLVGSTSGRRSGGRRR